ncbi:acyl-CoA carboxylase epsilon subunit [Streptomyces glaucus]|uniref:Acyl-CoA carboxylase epsilon subunit-like protein n=1 Tax=Streptomyces glaucus TaxID=284029 RepID=A0ABP5WGV9_9ACTN
MTAEDNPAAGVTAMPTTQSWRITSGDPTAEEVAAVAVALAGVLAANAAQAAQPTDAGTGRHGARWTPFSARRRTATSWAAGPLPGWRGAA